MDVAELQKEINTALNLNRRAAERLKSVAKQISEACAKDENLRCMLKSADRLEASASRLEASVSDAHSDAIALEDDAINTDGVEIQPAFGGK